MASQPTPEQRRLQMELLRQQMHELQQQEQEAARQAALLADSQTAQAATARAEQAEQRAAELQDVVDPLNARILSLEPDLARLQTANAQHAQEHADLAHVSGIVTSVKAALHEVGTDFAELVRTIAALLHSAQALAGNIVEQNIRLTPAIKALARHSAGGAAARSVLERPQQDVNAARTAGMQLQLQQ